MAPPARMYSFITVAQVRHRSLHSQSEAALGWEMVAAPPFSTVPPQLESAFRFATCTPGLKVLCVALGSEAPTQLVPSLAAQGERRCFQRWARSLAARLALVRACLCALSQACPQPDCKLRLEVQRPQSRIAMSLATKRSGALGCGPCPPEPAESQACAFQNLISQKHSFSMWFKPSGPKAAAG